MQALELADGGHPFEESDRTGFGRLADEARRARPTVALPDVPAPDTDPATALTWAEVRTALDEALTRLAAVEPQAAELVHLRYFAGQTMSAAADLLGLSLRSTQRLWAYARAWLLQELERN